MVLVVVLVAEVAAVAALRLLLLQGGLLVVSCVLLVYMYVCLLAGVFVWLVGCLTYLCLFRRPQAGTLKTRWSPNGPGYLLPKP